MERGTDVVGLNKRLTRRGALRLMGGLGAAAATSVIMPKAAGATSGSAYFRTTSALNLRAKASTSGKVLLVLPYNAKVQNLGQSSNGFFKVKYQGTTGWAYSVYLVSDVPDLDVNWIGDAKTTSSVNFRNSPSTSDDVLAVIAKGKTVTISDLVENGYRYVDAQGTLGWIYDDYLAWDDEPSGPLTFKTTTAVNLRENPSSSAKVIKVVPANNQVIDYDLVMSNGYRGVDYNGTVGWIYDDYLKQV
jgi:SH3-like domain-containing protein